MTRILEQRLRDEAEAIDSRFKRAEGKLVPPLGNAGQVLTKVSSVSNDAVWADLRPAVGIDDAIADTAPGANLVSRSVQKIGLLISTAVASLSRYATGRTTLASVAVLAGVPCYLAEAGREGWFTFETTNHSAHVTADTAQGIYVAPASDTTGASGAWVRKFIGPVNPAWFGLVDGDSSANGAVNDAAILAMFSCLASRAWNTVGVDRSLDPILFPPGTYWFSSTINLNYGTVRFEGSASSLAASSARFATIFKFPAGVTGIRLQGLNTSGSGTKDGANHTNAASTTIKGIYLLGSYTTTEGEFHGIHARTKCLIENVGVEKFEGDGIRVEANNATTGGNATSFLVRNVAVTNCRNGIRVTGDNVSASLVELPQLTSCRQAGIYDDCPIANTYIAPETNGCGLSDGNSTPCTVSSGGNLYFCIFGQEAGASINAPSGTATDNTWWGYWKAGAPSTGTPAWVSGTTYRAGGPVLTTNTAAYHLIQRLYAEINQPPCQITGRTMITQPDGASIYFTGGGLVSSSNTGVYTKGSASFNRPVLATAYDGLTATFWAALGGQSNQSVVEFRDPTNGTIGRLGYGTNGAAVADLALGWNNTAGGLVLTFASASTALTCGTGAVVPYSIVTKENLRTGTGNGARLITTAAAAPGAGVYAQGDLIRNNAYTGPTLPLGWVSKSTGGFTTDVWVSGVNAYGIGYVVGAGAAQTQGTNRTTGVAINKLTGKVTLFSTTTTAGQTTSFTLTNSQLGATDTIGFTQLTGAGVYFVTAKNNGDGTALVSVYTPAAVGSAEAPAFQFNIIRGAQS